MPRRRSIDLAPLPPFRVDAEAPLPLWQQIASHIEGAIRQGVVQPGDRLEGELGLASDYGVSRATMRRAINALVEKGILMRKHGVGTQVAPRAPMRTSGIRSLYDELQAKGLKPSTVVLRNELEPAPGFVAEALGLEEGQEVQAYERLRLVEDQPFGIMRNWLPAGLVEVDQLQLETDGLYETLRASGLSISLAQQSVGAEAAGPAQAELLQVPLGAPLLTMFSTAFVDLGRPIEHGRHDYLPERYRFEITNLER